MAKRGRKKFTRERFIENLRKKYGDLFIHLIYSLKDMPTLNASDIAREYGLTRERIRQICDLIHGKGFLKRRKKLDRKQCFLPKLLIPMKYNGKNGSKTRIKISTYFSFLRRLTHFGLTARHLHHSIFELSNGKRIHLTYTTKPFNHPYLRIFLVPQTVDFHVIGYPENGNFTFLIIPAEVTENRNGKKNHFYISNVRGLKYRQYLENFHLLANG